jgi:hypothetical protein
MDGDGDVPSPSGEAVRAGRATSGSGQDAGLLRCELLVCEYALLV